MPLDPLALASAECTRNFEVRHILVGYCGQLLTPDKVDEIAREIFDSMREGPVAWAFRVEDVK